MSSIDLPSLIQAVSVLALPVIFAITCHEAAHGFVASRLGDDTALMMGRVTFNPLKHIDPIGTVVMPLVLFFASNGHFLFGYAKPVPVNFGKLNRPRRDMVWVALAGPATNIVLAIVSALLLYVVPHIPPVFHDWLADTLEASIQINVILAVFNMIPLPPLDGGRVAVGILPDALAFPLARMERYGVFILIAVLFLLPMIGNHTDTNLDIMKYAMQGPVNWLVNVITKLTGVG